MIVDNEPDKYNDNRVMFAKIITTIPYKIQDRVAYIDGLTYVIWEIKPDGTFIIGYIKDGEEVKVFAPLSDFRHLSDVVQFVILEKARNGEIDSDKFIKVDFEGSAEDGGRVTTNEDKTGGNHQITGKIGRN